MKYDCFTFFNELDLLEIRLNVLNDIVDKFVLVEATRTQQNKEKPLYYKENKERFKEFQDKIIHIIVNDYPDNLKQWTIENYQRNCIKRGLKDCSPDDLIVISDLDEIPKPEILKEINNPQNIIAFDLNCFFIYLNKLVFGFNWDHGPKALTFKNFQTLLDDVPTNHGALDSAQNIGTTASKVRLYSGPLQKHILNAGWHFTHAGGEKMLLEQTRAKCEGNLNCTLKDMQAHMKIKKVQDYYLVDLIIDDTYPEYIRHNISKYKNFISSKGKFKGKTILNLHFKYMKLYKFYKRIAKNFHPDKFKKLLRKLSF